MKLLDHLRIERGSSARIATACGLSPAFLSQVANGVRNAPAERCPAIEAATAGAVRRWDLRPADWHRIWPELIGSDGAPDVPEPLTTQPAALDAPVSQAGALDAV